MPALLTVRQICEAALQEIGSYSLIDQGADPDEMARAGFWLDMIVGHMTGTGRRLWLTTDTISIPLAADKAVYTQAELNAASSNWPILGLQFPNHATVTFGGRNSDCEIINRARFDDIGDPALGGAPCFIYIDRTGDPKLRLWPVPATADYTLNLTGQTFHKTLLSDTTAPQSLQIASGLKEPWNLWAVTALAARLGDGPVRKLGDGTVRRKQAIADRLLEDLEAFENMEHDDEFPRVAFRDPGI